MGNRWIHDNSGSGSTSAVRLEWIDDMTVSNCTIENNTFSDNAVGVRTYNPTASHS